MLSSPRPGISSRHFKQAAVEERDGFVEFFNGSFLLKQRDVAEVALVAVMLVLALI